MSALRNGCVAVLLSSFSLISQQALAAESKASEPAKAGAKDAPKKDDTASKADNSSEKTDKTDKTEEKKSATETKEEKKTESKSRETTIGGETKENTDKKTDEVPRSANDPYEDSRKTYYFLGLRYRHTILPKFMLSIFADGGPSVVSIPTVGIEGTLRKDGMDTIFSLTYSDYSMATFPFKGKSEADTAFELVTSKLKLVNATVDLLWSSPMGKLFAFTYGMTVGVSVVFDELIREQATPPNGGTTPTDPYTYVRCSAKGQNKYCDGSNEHYNGYSEPSWFNGGKKPNVYAQLGPQIGVRFKPVKQFMARVDLGFNLFAGFFFGGSMSYGF